MRELIISGVVLVFISVALAMARAMEKYDAERCEWDGGEE